MQNVRWTHLDGIRGIAALIVAIFHFGLTFRTDLVFEPRAIHLSALWNGGFSVEMFFVLSGFLFFSKFYGASFDDAIRACAKRYVRLSFPVLAACIVAYLIHKHGGFYNLQAAAVTDSAWGKLWYKFEPSLWHAISEPLAGMYLSYDGTYSYNSNVWTIRYELFYIWLVIAIAVSCSRIPALLQIVLLASIAPFTWMTYAFAFIVGAALALIRLKFFQGSVSAYVAVPTLWIGIWLGSLSPFEMEFYVKQTIIWPVAAALVLFTCDAWPPLRAILSRAPLRWIGRIAFGTYMMHFITLNSFACWLYLATGSLTATFLGYISATLVAAAIFELCADRPITALADRLFSFGRRSVAIKAASAVFVLPEPVPFSMTIVDGKTVEIDVTADRESHRQFGLVVLKD